jgi:hypothetical protein
MAPSGHPGVRVIHWTPDAPLPEPGDTVIEAFACDPPAEFTRRMAAMARPPLWINLEYLSAEPFVERSHGLPSPQLSGPGAGLTKWFFYPGFTPATGGLLREADLDQRQQRFDPVKWLRKLAIQARPGERLASLFCYENTALPALLETLAQEPTLLLATAGEAAEQVARHLAGSPSKRALRAIALPRGEDSFVRAQWAAKPFVWQIYPQRDDAHLAKLQAFTDLFLGAAPPELAASLRVLWSAWNGSGGNLVMPRPGPWHSHVRAWREQLRRQEDLATQLMRFKVEKG